MYFKHTGSTEQAVVLFVISQEADGGENAQGCWIWEAVQAYPGWMIPMADWSSCGADPHNGDSAGPGRIEGPDEERQPLGGAALVPGESGRTVTLG